MTKVMYVVTTPLTYQALMRGHLRHMQRSGFDVTAVSAPGQQLQDIAVREGVAVEAVSMEREIRLTADSRSLVQLVRVLRRHRPDIVNAGTPKAGMLAMIAARLAGVPVRIYTLRGLRAETLDGTMGRIMSMTEKLTSWCATDVIAVSESLRQAYVDRGLAPAGKVIVLGSGSSNGIDPLCFAFADADRSRIRTELGIDDQAPVVGFVGRLVHDKGVDSLIAAFDKIKAAVPGAQLLLVGDFEQGDPVPDVTRARIETDDTIHLTGMVPDASRHYSAFDVLAFPSLREGFPNAPLEAAAAAVPTVGFNATGTRDAVVDGSTGALVAINDVSKLAERLTAYLLDADLRDRHGQHAAERAATEFHSEKIWLLLEQKYRQALLEVDVGTSEPAGGSP